MVADGKPIPKKMENKSNQKFNKSTNENLKGVKGGRVEKPQQKRPMRKKLVEADKRARKAMATGELASTEIDLKKQKDLRTLYIRFKNAETQPSNEDEIRSICPSVIFIRTPRQGKKKNAQKIKYCYMEFDSEATCDTIKAELAKSEDKFFVDFVGEKSKNMKFTSKDVNVKKRPINPFRLFISGLPKGMTLEKLKLLFPKSVLAQIKSKGSQVGFVQFESAADAKSAFDAAKKLSGPDLPAGIPKLTVTYARMEKRQPLEKRQERKNRKAEKAEKNEEEIKEESEDDDEEIKEESDAEEEEENVENDEDSDDAEEVEESINAGEMEEGDDDENDDDDDDDEDVENDQDSEEEENE